MRQQRILAVLVVLTCGLVGIWLRLFRLQVVEHHVWASESERSLSSFETLPFERGWILDRHGEPLARTEEARDLHFRFRSWRQRDGAVLGHLVSVMWLLDGERRSVGETDRYAEPLLGGLGTITVAELGAIEPRQRRQDVLTYLGWLYGDALERAVATQLASGPDAWTRLADLPPFAAGQAAAVVRARRERDAFDGLARVAGTTSALLLDEIDAAVRRSDQRVAVALSRDPGDAEEGGEVPVVRAVIDGFRRLRELHAEFDAEPVRLVTDVPQDVRTLVAVRRDELPGFEVRAESRRAYPERWADTAPLLVGRVGAPLEERRGLPGDLEEADANRRRLAALSALEEPTEAELVEYDRLRILVREIDYRSTEERGTLGLEAALEPILRGKRGWVAEARAGEVESRLPVRGLNVTLTLDADLQAAAEHVLDRVLAGELFRDDRGRPEGWPGAIVLLDPRTGEVLALASSPRPTREALTTRYGELREDPWGPLFDRALGPGDSGNLPPPGSTFKPLEALLALGDGLVSPNQRFDCNGRLTLGQTVLRCTGVHPGIDLKSAIARSCNIWFYRFASLVGGEELLRAATVFGYGQPSGLLDNEVLDDLGIRLAGGVADAVVPLSERVPTGSEAMRTAIGQALLDDVTPLQVAVALGAIGQGELRPPSLLMAVEGWGALPPRPARSLGVPASALAVVRDALGQVVDRGTASRLDDELARAAAEVRARDPQAQLLDPRELASLVAGKTGTAQVAGTPRSGGWLERRLAERPEMRDESGLLPDHSWFAGYLPREKPSLAFAVLLEHSGRHGGDACVPVLARLLSDPAVQRRLREEGRP